MLFNGIFLIGLAFVPIAALAAFLITYGEYEHHYPDKKEPLRIGLEAALLTSVVFIFLATVIGLFL